MFLQLQSGEDICLAHITSVLPMSGKGLGVHIKVSDGRSIKVQGLGKTELEKMIKDALSYVSSNTATYGKFEKFSAKVEKALEQTSTLMETIEKAGGLTQDVMKTLETQAVTLKKETDRARHLIDVLQNNIMILDKIIKEDA